MPESKKRAARKRKPKKYLYAVRCWHCKQQIPVDVVWARNGVQLEELRAIVEAKGILGSTVTCSNTLEDASKCGAANPVLRDEVEFAQKALAKHELTTMNPFLEESLPNNLAK
jgi:hypothetical protein